MSTEVTITIPVKEATQAHIEHLQATLTKRNERIAQLEERLAEAEAGEPNRERLGREFRAGYESAVINLSAEISKLMLSLEKVRGSTVNAYIEGPRLVQVEEDA